MVIESSKAHRTQTLADRLADPDFVDRVWDYLLANFPQLKEVSQERVHDVKQQIRRGERGERPYITPASPSAREMEAKKILRLFNTMNATEVARVVGCSRATVYRVLKQSGYGA
jgi:DNA invertase Pin-like site-specific DNA recombinase